MGRRSYWWCGCEASTRSNGTCKSCQFRQVIPLYKTALFLTSFEAMYILVSKVAPLWAHLCVCAVGSYVLHSVTSLKLTSPKFRLENNSYWKIIHICNCQCNSGVKSFSHVTGGCVPRDRRGKSDTVSYLTRVLQSCTTCVLRSCKTHSNVSDDFVTHVSTNFVRHVSYKSA